MVAVFFMVIFFGMNSVVHADTLLSDDFSGTSINTSFWNILDPTGTNITQNNSLSVDGSFANQLWGQTAAITKQNFSRTGLTISAKMSGSSAQLLAYGDYNFQAAGSSAYIIDIVGPTNGSSVYALSWINGTVPDSNFSCGTHTVGATYSMKVTATGFEVYKNTGSGDTLLCSLTTSAALTNKPAYFESQGAGTYNNLLVSGASSAQTSPGLPNGLSAQAGDGKANLNWTIPSTDGGSTITDYVVEYKLSSSDTWGTFDDGISTTTSAVVTGLINNLSYDFRVSAVNAVGTSDPSLVVTATPLPPAVPANVTDVIASAGDGQAILSWSAPADGGSSILDYAIDYRMIGDSVWIPFVHTASTATVATIANLTDGTAYEFRVRAINSVGTGGDSNIPGATPAAVSNSVPLTISNLALWLDGSDVATITQAGGAVTQVDDKSGNGNSATASGSASPLFVGGAQNGLSVLRFDGASNFLSIGNSITYKTVFVVAKFNGSTFSDYNGLIGDSDAGHVLDGNNGTTNIAKGISDLDSAFRDGVQAAGTGSGNNFAPINEYWIGSFDINAGQTDATSTIGAIGGGATRKWHGDIGEVIVYDRILSTFERQTIEAYLGNKWGIAVPVTVPVAPSAPTIGAVTAADGQVSVAFSPPTSNGGSAITGYTVTSDPDGITATGSTSPVVVSGLTNGKSYTFTVTATNDAGTSPPSASSASIAPVPLALFDDFTGTTINTGKWMEVDPAGSGGTAGNVQQNGTLSIANSYDGSAWGRTALYSLQNFSANSLDISSAINTGSSALIGYGDYNFSDASSNAYLLYITGPNSQILALTWSGGVYQSLSCGTDTPGATYEMKIISGGFQVYKNNTLLCTMNTTTQITDKPIFMESATAASTFDNVSVIGSATVISAPDAPIIGNAVAGNNQATVSFTPPVSNGGSVINNYTATSIPDGIVATGSSSPIIVTGLTNDKDYTFTVTAQNGIGTSLPSDQSNSVTPHFIFLNPPLQVTDLFATGVNGQALLSWTAPDDGGDSAIFDYLIEYKLSADDQWQTFAHSQSASTKAIVTGLTDGSSYDFRVSAINGGGAGASSDPVSATPKPIATMSFVLAGESNSGGIGSNSQATPEELAPRPAVQILDLNQDANFLTFENLQIGGGIGVENNLVDHAGLESYYGTSHGLELQLADSASSGAFPDHPVVYLTKTGEGGSTIGQWNVGGTYWNKFLQRTDAAKTQLPENTQWIVWYSQGINDAIAGTPGATWEAATIAHLNKIKAQLPGAIIIMTEFESMPAGNGYPAYNALIKDVAATQPNVFSVDSTGAATDGANHWSYAGLKTMGTRMVSETKNVLGLDYSLVAPAAPSMLEVQ